MGTAYECVITAAGASSRMGSLWKPLLPFGSSTILETTVARALDAGLRVVLVVGFRGDELAERFSGAATVSVVRNPAWEAGLLGSVLAGFAAAEGELVFSMNGDKPLAFSRTYRLLQEEAERRAASGGTVPPIFAAYRGKRGHPVLIPRAIALGASRLGPEGRMRDHLAAFGPIALECGDEGAVLDIDTEEEYGRLVSRIGPNIL